jgi:hypothetical protein
MLVNCQQLAARGANPFSKFSLICANELFAKNDNVTSEQRVKIFFIFLGLNV